MIYYGQMSGEKTDLRRRKKFNTAGTCFPELPYMVDVTERLERIRSLFGDGEYFCINRGRQYGKTTTLEALSGFLKDEYTVFQISFEGSEDSMYADLESVLAGFMRSLALRVELQEGLPLSEAVRKMFAEADFGARERYSVRDFRLFVARMCKANDRPVVVLIDEVDQAGNYDSFVKFLGYQEMALAVRFGFVKEAEGPLRIHNRIFETYLYNYFVVESEMNGKAFGSAQDPQSIFVRPDGTLDMPLVPERFVATFNEIYGERGEKFLEEEGRRYFMPYVKPIINGTGNYYIEPETRDALRSDMIIDYRGHRYVIEMKIWRGEAYNERGERQLAEYLDRFDVDVGYRISFCFNRNKVPGLKARFESAPARSSRRSSERLGFAVCNSGE